MGGVGHWGAVGKVWLRGCQDTSSVNLMVEECSRELTLFLLCVHVGALTCCLQIFLCLW